MPYRVLVIAPETNLVMVSAEVMNVVNALGAKILQGAEADVYGLLNMINEPYDLLWFATHGDEKGVYLSEGELLSTSELTTVVRSTGAQLTVLNTCSSRSVAVTIHDELRTEFVCTIKPVPDRTAFITGTIFARKLAEGLSFFEAYQQAKPGQNSTYAYLGSEGNALMPPTYDRNQGSRSEGQDLNSLADLIRRLEVIVNGSPQWNVEGLVPSVKRMEAKLDQLKVEVAELRSNQRVNRRWVVTLASVCSLLFVAVALLLYMQGGV